MNSSLRGTIEPRKRDGIRGTASLADPLSHRRFLGSMVSPASFRRFRRCPPSHRSYTVPMTDPRESGSSAEVESRIRLGVVEFLNSQPIISGLDRLEDLELKYAVPSRLVHLLDEGHVDAALCSSIDYHRAAHELLLLPAPPLGCDGATHTVRLYSRHSIETVDRVHCDTDSHTSVILLQVLFRELHGRAVEVVPFDASAGSNWPDAVLLIGDKVVSSAPDDAMFPHQLDLGEAWKDLTGLPFIFGVWLARADGDADAHRLVCMLLDRQYRYNRMHLESVVAHAGAHRAWPDELAHHYLSNEIRYECGPRQRAGLERFYELAGRHGLVELRLPIRWLEL